MIVPVAKKYPKGVVPPCPGNPAHYTLVNRDGYFHHRLNRGTLKPAKLNPAFLERNIALSDLSPAISQLRHILLPLMKPLPTGKLQSSLFKWLQKAWINHRHISFDEMKGSDLHPKYRLWSVLQERYRSTVNDDQLQLFIPAAGNALHPKNNLVTDFLLEAILLWQDEDGFETIIQTSPIYKASEGIMVSHTFEWSLPECQAWMLLLKISCFEGSQYATHPMHYGIKVLETGSSIGK
jgi:hypothetical protein